MLTMLAVALGLSSQASAAPEAWQPTPPDVVEVDVERNAMRFVVDPRDTRPLADWGGVEVDARPGRTVLSVGMTGAYTESRYLDGVERLQEWLRDHPEWEAMGEPIAIYWNGPYVPGPLKRSEVHLPVARVLAEAAR